VTPDEVTREVRRIEITTRHLVRDIVAGEYSSAFRGRGVEFAEVREYQPGDDVRTIDWNVTARLGSAYVKRYLEERELTVVFLVDFSASGRFGSRVRTKGELGAEDFLVVDLDGQVRSEGKKPSAELPLHLQLYRRDESLGAVLHTHSLNATLLSRLHRDELVLEGYEVLKALQGIQSHEARVVVPVFANDQDVPRLAARVQEYMAEHPGLHGYLISGHGFYTWGRSVAEASRHIEAFEFLFACELELRRLGR